jgi:hypothetical protein
VTDRTQVDRPEVWPLLGLLSESSADDLQAARLLASDFLASVRANGARDGGVGDLRDGPMEIAARLAATASAADLDDVDWSGPLHTGSVVWSAVLGAGAAWSLPGSRVLHAGVCGYRVARAAAAMLGGEHSRRWHLTATAGALGASVAVSVVRGHHLELTARALAFSMLNLGGLGQAPLERRGAARATRAYAAAHGVLSVMLARSDVPTVDAPWSGSRGVERVLQAGGLSTPVEESPWTSVGLRLYPVNGFIHSAVRATADVRPEVNADDCDIVWELPEATLSMVDSADHGVWWDARLAAARAIGTRSPWLVDRAGPWDELAEGIRLQGADLPVGSARVRIAAPSFVETYEVPPLTIAGERDSRELAHTKWTRVLGIDADAVSAMVDAMVTDEPNWAHLLSALSR